MRSLVLLTAALVMVSGASAGVAADPSSLEARLKRVGDQQAIERLLLHYGRTLDDRDFAYSALFAEAGVWDGGMGVLWRKAPAATQAAARK